MNIKKKQGILAIALIVIILVIDQWIKIDVKTTMTLHESHKITNWYYVFFIENNGMAYGISFIPKIALSLFRFVAITFISVYLIRQIAKGARWVYVILLSMIIAGAAGNLIDCMFYGMIFSESTPFDVSHLVPFGQGYEDFLHGRVVDMFYFPIIQTHWPEWMPIWGGQEFIFFSPVFNFADASISVSVVLLLLLCRKEMAIAFDSASKENDALDEDEDEDNALDEDEDEDNALDKTNNDGE